MSAKKRVLIVGPSPTKSKGGMATVIEEIQSDSKLNEQFDIDIYESYIDGGIFKRLLYSAWAYLKFCFTKKDYDIYHIHAASYGSTFRKGLFVKTAKRWGKKVILHIHGAEYMKFYEGLSDRKKQKVIDILKDCNMIIALSQDWKNKFDVTFGLNNCVVLENGINVERLKPAISDPSNHPHSFVMLGRLGERKGTYDLIEAIENVAKKIPDIKCYLVGDGEIDKCSSTIKEKHLENNISIEGWANFDKKLKLLKQSSVLVLPSYNEGLPMAILEGMACGKAIISTTVGAIPEVVKDENGILIEPGDVTALARALVNYSTDEITVDKIGKTNIYTANKRYSMEAMHQRLAQYYSYIMQGSGV